MYINNVNRSDEFDVCDEPLDFNYNNRTNSATNGTNSGLDRIDDNIGLFPIYFFVHNLKCTDMKIKLIVMNTTNVANVKDWT